jgi:protein-S-isoprenylcysteine O-methyltransferase Ste14
VLPWQESSYIIFSVTGLFIYSLRIPWVISAFGLILGIKSLKEFDLFGRNQIDKYMNNREDKEMEFVSRGPCKIVRNPFYLFILIMIWSYPILSMDRLLFLDLWSVWKLIGTILEERDLVNQIGEGYKEYQSYLLRLLQSITA